MENDRWALFRSYYGFDAFYCQPGIEGAHEKGGVEGEVGRFRSTALARARAAGTFTSAHEAFWAAARKTDGDAAGTRELIDVLLLHRSMDTNDVVAGLTTALTVDAVTADVVAVEARIAAARRGHPDCHPTVPSVPVEPRVVSLTQPGSPTPP